MEWTTEIGQKMRHACSLVDLVGRRWIANESKTSNDTVKWRTGGWESIIISGPKEPILREKEKLNLHNVTSLYAFSLAD